MSWMHLIGELILGTWSEWGGGGRLDTVGELCYLSEDVYTRGNEVYTEDYGEESNGDCRKWATVEMHSMFIV